MDFNIKNKSNLENFGYLPSNFKKKIKKNLKKKKKNLINLTQKNLVEFFFLNMI